MPEKKKKIVKKTSKNKSKRKVKQIKNLIHGKSKLKVLVMICLVLSMLVGGMGWYFIKTNVAPSYREYVKENKKYGKVRWYEKDNDDFYTLIYYPHFQDDNLNNIVEQKYQTYLEDNKPRASKKDVLFGDYECKRVYNQFVVIKYEFSRIKEDFGNTIEEKTLTVMTYDERTGRVLTLDDCLRGNYDELLKELHCIRPDVTSTEIEVQEKQFVFYKNENLEMPFEIEYKKNKDYIALRNKKIPSLIASNVKDPNFMEINSDKKMVAITFDDGPNKKYTQEAMTILEKYNGRATFFATGENIEKYPNVVKDIYERGHEVANHTYCHEPLTKLTRMELEEDIKKTQDLCFDIIGEEPKLFRPPLGVRTDAMNYVIKNNNLQLIMWDADTMDKTYAEEKNGSKTIANNIVNAATSNKGDGNIILIHDTYKNSIDSLDKALEKLSKKGYQFVTVSDLLKYKGHTLYK